MTLIYPRPPRRMDILLAIPPGRPPIDKVIEHLAANGMFNKQPRAARQPKSERPWNSWRRKAVIATLPDGTTETYGSIQDAATVLGVVQSGIGNAVNGRQCSAAGRRWRLAPAPDRT